MRIHMNCIGGLAGDMFCAALLDAYPELLHDLGSVISNLKLPVPVDIELADPLEVVSGKKFNVITNRDAWNEHLHTSHRSIRDLITKSEIPKDVIERSLYTFQLLAEAEAEVHNADPDDVVFHEVGSWDSIVDIVSASFLIESLNINEMTYQPLPLGRGQINSHHGVIPIPAPATAKLLKGFSVLDDGIEGERVTPTGAAIFKSLSPVLNKPDFTRLENMGLGYGTKKIPGIPNCVQVLFLSSEDEETAELNILAANIDSVRVINFEIDDQSPEDLATALDHIRSVDGVLSVTSIQAIGKNGRMTMRIEILSNACHFEEIVINCFNETSTIGLRWLDMDRYILNRENVHIDNGIEVKIVKRPHGYTAKTENRSVARLSTFSDREKKRKIGENQSLEGYDE